MAIGRSSGISSSVTIADRSRCTYAQPRALGRVSCQTSYIRCRGLQSWYRSASTGRPLSAPRTPREHDPKADERADARKEPVDDDRHRRAQVARREPGLHRVVHRRPGAVVRDHSRTASAVRSMRRSTGARRCSARPTSSVCCSSPSASSPTSGSATPTRTSAGRATRCSSAGAASSSRESAGRLEPDHPAVRGGARHRRRAAPRRVLRRLHLSSPSGGRSVATSSRRNCRSPRTAVPW